MGISLTNIIICILFVIYVLYTHNYYSVISYMSQNKELSVYLWNKLLRHKFIIKLKGFSYWIVDQVNILLVQELWKKFSIYACVCTCKHWRHLWDMYAYLLLFYFYTICFTTIPLSRLFCATLRIWKSNF